MLALIKNTDDLLLDKGVNLCFEASINLRSVRLKITNITNEQHVTIMRRNQFKGTLVHEY